MKYFIYIVLLVFFAFINSIDAQIISIKAIDHETKGEIIPDHPVGKNLHDGSTIEVTNTNKVALSKIISGINHFGNKSKKGIKIYPNPASSSARVIVNSEKSLKDRIILTDLQGKIVLSKTIFLNKGKSEFNLKMDNNSQFRYLFSCEEIMNMADKIDIRSSNTKNLKITEGGIEFACNDFIRFEGHFRK